MTLTYKQFLENEYRMDESIFSFFKRNKQIKTPEDQRREFNEYFKRISSSAIGEKIDLWLHNNDICDKSRIFFVVVVDSGHIYDAHNEKLPVHEIKFNKHGNDVDLKLSVSVDKKPGTGYAYRISDVKNSLTIGELRSRMQREFDIDPSDSFTYFRCFKNFIASFKPWFDSYSTIDDYSNLNGLYSIILSKYTTGKIHDPDNLTIVDAFIGQSPDSIDIETPAPTPEPSAEPEPSAASKEQPKPKDDSPQYDSFYDTPGICIIPDFMKKYNFSQNAIDSMVNDKKSIKEILASDDRKYLFIQNIYCSLAKLLGSNLIQVRMPKTEEEAEEAREFISEEYDITEDPIVDVINIIPDYTDLTIYKDKYNSDMRSIDDIMASNDINDKFICKVYNILVSFFGKKLIKFKEENDTHRSTITETNEKITLKNKTYINMLNETIHFLNEEQSKINDLYFIVSINKVIKPVDVVGNHTLTQYQPYNIVRGPKFSAAHPNMPLKNYVQKTSTEKDKDKTIKQFFISQEQAQIDREMAAIAPPPSNN